MELGVSFLFFELALIFIPGFIWMKIHTRYGARTAKTQFDLLLNTFIFGVLSYAILYLIYWLFGVRPQLFDLEADSKKLFFQPGVFLEIFEASLIAIVGGIATLYVENYKLVTNLIQKIGASNTFGGEDLWDYVLSLRIPSADFVHFRDFEQRVTYAGIIVGYSESEKLRELILDAVIVYDFKGKKMYEVPRLYLARPREGIHLEFPIKPVREKADE